MLSSSSIFFRNESWFIVIELPKTFEGMHSITSPILTESSIFEESDMYTIFFLMSMPMATVLSPSFLFVPMRTTTGFTSSSPSISTSVASFP